jgi:PAS domain S-box-containing protein
MLRHTFLRLSTFDLLIGLLVIVIFVVDLWTPLGISVGLLYIIPVWLTAWSYRPNLPAILSIVCAILTVAGAWFGPPGAVPLWYAVVNRSMSLFAILAGGYLAQKERSTRSQLAQEMAQRQATEELRRTQKFLASIVENMPDMVFVKDARELRFVLVNKAAEDLLGHSRAEMLGKDAYDLFPRHEADMFTGQDREVLRHGQLLDIPEEPMQSKHGSRTVHAKKIPIVDDEGKRLYLLGIARDITETKRLEKERENLIAQLKDSLAKITTLEGILPICAHCKRIRDDKGEWHSVENYVRVRSKAEFSHGICPICLTKHYPGHTPPPPAS